MEKKIIKEQSNSAEHPAILCTRHFAPQPPASAGVFSPSPQSRRWLRRCAEALTGDGSGAWLMVVVVARHIRERGFCAAYSETHQNAPSGSRWTQLCGAEQLGSFAGAPVRFWVVTGKGTEAARFSLVLAHGGESRSHF